jgi:hypothetical protein
MKGKLIAALGLGATVLIASQAAMAGVSVGFNIGVPAPVYVAPAPVYAPPPPPPVVAYAPPPVVAVPVVAPVITIGWHSGRYWDGRRWYSQREWGYYHGGYGYHRW